MAGPEIASFTPCMKPIPFRKCSSCDAAPYRAHQRRQSGRTQEMNATPAISRWVSLATLAAFAGLLLVLAFAPQPSLYAG